MLCNTCQTLFRKHVDLSYVAARSQEILPHHTSLAGLQISANQGCVICQRIKSSLRQSPDKTHESDLLRLHYDQYILPNGLWNNSASPFPSISNRALNLHNIGVSLEIVPIQDLKNGTLPLPKPRQHNIRTDSCESWDLVKSWYTQCLTNHSSCNKIRNDVTAVYYPTCLLDLGIDDRSSIRVLNTKVEQPVSPYMTLSHRWGTSPEFLKLTTQNLDAMSQNISLSAVPKTYQDAVKITRQLQIRYLWVDSLCIIQDSEDDWRREALTMTDVYSFAVCNIAATWASSSNDGCFTTRDPSRLEPPYLDVIDKRGIKIKCLLIDNQLWERSITKSPLNSRAWVVQERLLPRRIVHFGKEQLFWECREYTACEMYDQGMPPSCIDTLSFVTMKKVLGQENKRHMPGTATVHQKLDEHCLWRHIVEAYSNTNLTKANDKLVAIGGLAKRLQMRLETDYVAGLWRSNMPYHLLWLCEWSEQRPKDYRAPSWSWASVDSPILYYLPVDDTILEPLISVIEMRVTNIDDNCFGEVSDGFLRIQCSACTFKADERCHEDPLFMFNELQEDPFFVLDGSTIYYRCVMDEKKQNQQETLTCMPVMRYPIKAEDDGVQNDSHQIVGLILEPASPEHDIFVRCGLIWYVTEGENPPRYGEKKILTII